MVMKSGVYSKSNHLVLTVVFTALWRLDWRGLGEVAGAHLRAWCRYPGNW